MPECGEQYWHLLESEDTSLAPFVRRRTVYEPFVGFWCDGIDYAAWAVRSQRMDALVTREIDELANPDKGGHALPEKIGLEYENLHKLTEGIPPPGEMRDCKADTLRLVDLGKMWTCLYEQVLTWADEIGEARTTPKKAEDLPQPKGSGSGGGFLQGLGQGVGGLIVLGGIIWLLTRGGGRRRR